MEWTNKKVLELIAAYRVLPVLWDASDPCYRDKSKKKEAWLSLADAIGYDDTKEIGRKIHNLRGQYQREAARLKYQRYERDVESKWFAYKPLNFLQYALRTQKDTSSEQLSESIISEERLESGSFQEEKLNEMENGMDRKEFCINNNKRKIINNEMQHQRSKLIHHRLRSKKKRQHNGLESNGQREFEDMCLKEVYQTMSTLKQSNRTQDYDEYSIYGENIAAKLRKLNNTTAVSVLQYIINTAIFESEMGLYNNIERPQGLAAQIVSPPFTSCPGEEGETATASIRCAASSNWDNNSQLSESS